MQSSRSERIGWYMYDWANSAFYTTVITVFLGPYLTTVTENAADINGMVSVFGISMKDGSFFSYCISLSVFLQIFFLPIFSTLADKTGRKKEILGSFAFIGSIAAMFMYFVQGDNFLFGGSLLIISNVSFGVSAVIYNSYLNDLSSEKERDKISSIGWAVGFLGGGILLALNLVFYTLASEGSIEGIDGGEAVRICLASAGVWWAMFTIIPMITLKYRKPKYETDSTPNNFAYLKTGFSNFFKTLKEMKKYPKSLAFLIAFLLYNDGVQTVIVMASIFGEKELGFDKSVLITTILMVQFLAFFGSLLFNLVSNKIGGKNTIMISLGIWTLCLIAAYGVVDTELSFYILAAVIALVLGGTQAISRSLFSKLIPAGKEAQYFSFYEISDRGTSWLGPLLFGLAYQFTDSYRLAILSLILFFVLGGFILKKIDINKAINEVKLG